MRRSRLDAEVDAQLDGTRTAHGSTAEEGALEQIAFVEDVVDEELRAHDCVADQEAIAERTVGDEARIDVDVPVEVEESGADRACDVGAICESRTIDARCAREEAALRIHDRRD